MVHKLSLNGARRDPWRCRAPRSAAVSITAACAAALIMAAGLARAEDAPTATAPADTVAAQAQATSADSVATPAQSTTPAAPAPAAQPALPNDFFGRFIKWYEVEWGKAGPPDDPNAPPSRRAAPWPAQPETTPPMPFTEWPYGGATDIGTNRTASVDSPLMVALAPSPIGKAMAAAGLQLYGWVDVGGNISPMNVKGGNAPAAYDYNPNTVQLDQAVVYFERTPDTVQSDHIDWGFRLSAIYGENYRYTTSYGVASYQLLKYNDNVGYDFPMEYVELYVPKVAQGLLIRIGRFISLPDIEAQLAPNNYMYTHSMTYTYDNYTNTGIQTTLAVTKNIFLQLGLSDGSETALWNAGRQLPNLYVLAGNADPLYPGKVFRKDPGNQPSLTACLRIQSNSARDNIYLCADSINKGTYGYNNLQWYGLTYYHKFNDHWHISIESWHIQENGVPNTNNPVTNAIIAGGGTPFSPQYMPFNSPNGAQCRNPSVLTCNAPEQSAVFYLNYSPNPLDNFSLRGEVFDDIVGQRTGFANTYYEWALGWQHWLSPQIELRPEVTYYHAANQDAFDGNSNLGIAPTKRTAVIGAGDIIWHF
jgi:hypothetical protein